MTYSFCRYCTADIWQFSTGRIWYAKNNGDKECADSPSGKHAPPARKQV